MKIKTELQGASPDIREVQLTLKRFLIDLDVKEAYEFSILNAFLINEEELNAILADVEKQQFTANTYQSNISAGMQLDFPRRRDSSSDEDENDSPMGSSQKSPNVASQQMMKKQRKSIMHADLERIAADAQSKGE